MGFRILDGRGRGNYAAVSPNGQLNTKAITEAQVLAAAESGLAYNLVLPTLTITDAVEWGTVYLANTSSNYYMVLDAIRVSIGKSTGGAGVDTPVSLYSLPSGTLVSGGTAGTPLNLNLGVATPAVMTYKYATAYLTVAGTLISGRILTNPDYRELGFGIYLPNATGLALGVKGPTGNTSMAVRVTATVYFKSMSEG